MLEVGGHFFNAVITTLIGHLVVLIFASFPLFKIYYGRMYVVIILIGLLHGLWLLPVLFPLLTKRKNKTDEKLVQELSEPKSNGNEITNDYTKETK